MASKYFQDYIFCRILDNAYANMLQNLNKALKLEYFGQIIGRPFESEGL